MGIYLEWLHQLSLPMYVVRKTFLISGRFIFHSIFGGKEVIYSKEYSFEQVETF